MQNPIARQTHIATTPDPQMEGRTLNTLEFARLKRAAERRLKSRGHSNPEARAAVAAMSVDELLATIQPTVKERLREIFSYARG